VSQTALENIIANEHGAGTTPTLTPATSKKVSYSNVPSSTSPMMKKRKLGSLNDFSREDSFRKFQDPADADDLNGDGSDEFESEDGGASTALNGSDILESALQSDPSFSSALGPYSSDNQLEYLEDGFQVIAVLVRVNAARLKDDMRKEGTRMNAWDMGGEVKGGRRELQAKFSLLEKRMEKRLEATRLLIVSHGGELETDLYLPTNENSGSPQQKTEGSYGMPRLEIISARLNLDSFEKRLILLLIGKTVSPVVKALMDTLEQGSGFLSLAIHLTLTRTPRRRCAHCWASSGNFVPRFSNTNSKP
jgi:hypothetical protein